MAIVRAGANVPMLADRVLAVVDAYWSDPDREAHEAAYIARLRDRIRAYEQRYDFSSSDIHRRIENGTLVEDRDVADWIFAVRELELAEA